MDLVDCLVETAGAASSTRFHYFLGPVDQGYGCFLSLEPQFAQDAVSEESLTSRDPLFLPGLEGSQLPIASIDPKF